MPRGEIDMRLSAWRARLRPHYHAVRKPALRAFTHLLRRLPISSMVYGPPKGIVPTAKQWVEEWNARPGRPRAEYHEIAPAEEVTLRPAQTVQEPHPVFDDKRIRFAPMYVAEIPYGRVLDCYGNVIGPDDRIIGDLSYDWIPGRYIEGCHTLLSRTRLPAVHHVRGKVAALRTPLEEFYGHWILDGLPRLLALEASGLALHDIGTFIGRGSQDGARMALLRLLGVPMERFVESTASPHVRAETLVIASLTAGPNGTSPARACLLRNCLLPLARTVNGPFPARIYCTRSHTAKRRLLNEHDVLRFLNSLGFRCIVPEDYTIIEQVALFANAEAVVLPHGSAGANCVFMPLGSKVIELVQPRYACPSTRIACAAVGAEYYYITARGSDTTTDAWAEDIVCDLDVLRQTLCLARLA